MKIGDKIVFFSDIHIGNKSNERRHNNECLAFVKWMIEEAKEFGADVSIFGGDFHHHRSTVQVTTLNTSIEVFELLNNNFKKHFQIIGNHDIFFREKRELNSIEFGRNLPNIKIINEITKIGDVTLVPWLVGNEYKKMSNIKTPYVFGHFEFPFFLMNAMVAMPEHGHINANQFQPPVKHVFSGHFHKRQKQTNKYGVIIEYTGNCFPHNFSDAWDDDRGIMLLELGKEPIYKAWPDAPKYRTFNLSQLLEDPSKHLDSKTNAKITMDVEISYEEAGLIRDTFIKDYGVRELSLIPFKEQLDNVVFDSTMKFETIDQIVSESINSIDSESLDKNLLMNIYNNI